MLEKRSVCVLLFFFFFGFSVEQHRQGYAGIMQQKRHVSDGRYSIKDKSVQSVAVIVYCFLPNLPRRCSQPIRAGSLEDSPDWPTGRDVRPDAVHGGWSLPRNLARGGTSL